MPRYIHISVMRKMLDSGKPCDISLWTRTGAVQHWHNCVSLRYHFYAGTRTVKLLDSRQLRTVRDTCIFRINDLIVYI